MKSSSEWVMLQVYWRHDKVISILLIRNIEAAKKILFGRKFSWKVGELDITLLLRSGCPRDYIDISSLHSVREINCESN